MKKAFLLAIAAAVVFPMISMADESAAQPEPQKVQKERKAPQGPTLFKFDANKYGVVTKDELPADNKFIEGMFNHTDADKDGKVTKEEEAARKAELQKRYEQRKANAGDRPRRPQPPKGPRPQGQRPQGPRPDGFRGPQGPRGPQQGPTLFKFDANKDGVVTKDELPKDNKFIEGMFNHTDADKDGKVTKEEEAARKAELQKRYEQRRANAGARPQRPMPPKGQRPQGQRPQGPRPDFKGPQGPRGPMTLFKFDVNKDGVVTKDELPKDNKFVEGMFDRTDADKDGKVTKEEEDAHKAELQKRYEQRKANGPKPGKPGKPGKKPAPEKK